MAARDLGLVEQTLRNCVKAAEAGKLPIVLDLFNREIVGWTKKPRMNERVRGTTYATRADAQADLFDYIEVFYNRSRRHSMLGYGWPVRSLENWISQHINQQPEAA